MALIGTLKIKLQNTFRPIISPILKVSALYFIFNPFSKSCKAPIIANAANVNPNEAPKEAVVFVNVGAAVLVTVVIVLEASINAYVKLEV